METVGSNDRRDWGNTPMCTCLGWKWRGTLLWWADKTTEQFKKVSCALIDTDVSHVVNYSTRSISELLAASICLFGAIFKNSNLPRVHRLHVSIFKQTDMQLKFKLIGPNEVEDEPVLRLVPRVVWAGQCGTRCSWTTVPRSAGHRPSWARTAYRRWICVCSTAGRCACEHETCKKWIVSCAEP